MLLLLSALFCLLVPDQSKLEEFNLAGFNCSEKISVRHGSQPVVSYQACLGEDYLLIKAVHQESWHTYAMDNELRAKKALQGKMSLGIEQGNQIKVEDGLELEGPWFQSSPLDLSQPKLRWFTYGFEKTAIFACRVKRVTAPEAVVRVKGQACSGETCCLVDVTLKLTTQTSQSGESSKPSSGTDRIKTLLEGLVQVSTATDEALP